MDLLLDLILVLVLRVMLLFLLLVVSLRLALILVLPSFLYLFVMFLNLRLGRPALRINLGFAHDRQGTVEQKATQICGSKFLSSHTNNS